MLLDCFQRRLRRFVFAIAFVSRGMVDAFLWCVQEWW